MPVPHPPETRQDTYIDQAAVAEFGAVHRGPVIGPADVRFDGARRSFNALIEARPELIVRPIDDADVAAAIGFARARGLGVGGTHAYALVSMFTRSLETGQRPRRQAAQLGQCALAYR